MPTATGPFEVKITPLPADERPDAASLGRMAIDKTFRGELEAVSVGQMLAVRDAQLASGGYVALERVTGTLGGRAGSFVLQHSGHMARGAQSLAIQVVADSGTEHLAGLTGTMTITNAGGAHGYTFDYQLPA